MPMLHKEGFPSANKKKEKKKKHKASAEQKTAPALFENTAELALKSQ